MGRGFASGFLQIPPHDAVGCRAELPGPGRTFTDKLTRMPGIPPKGSPMQRGEPFLLLSFRSWGHQPSHEREADVPWCQICFVCPRQRWRRSAWLGSMLVIAGAILILSLCDAESKGRAASPPGNHLLLGQPPSRTPAASTCWPVPEVQNCNTSPAISS